MDRTQYTETLLVSIVRTHQDFRVPCIGDLPIIFAIERIKRIIGERIPLDDGVDALFMDDFPILDTHKSVRHYLAHGWRKVDMLPGTFRLLATR